MILERDFHRALSVICSVLSMFLTGTLEAQSFYTRSCDPMVKTVQTIVDGDFRRLPVIGLDDATKVSISFDYLASDQAWVDYTVVHCDAQWNRDDLSEMDYLDYRSLPQHVESIEPSFNTFLSYYHYSIELPNEEVSPTVSGNYAVLFHLQDEPDSILAVACFMVSEKQAFVSGEVSGSTDIDFQSVHQQLQMEIAWSDKSLPYLQPSEDLKVLVQQNRRRDNQRWIEHPSSILVNKALYEHDRQLIFEAGNHWRRFEFTDERYPGLGVDRVRYQSPIYCAYLNTDRARPTDSYRYDQDQHGRYKVHALHVDDMDTEAEYFMAQFTLDAPASLDAQGIYLVGDLTNQEIDESSRMVYDPEDRLYHKSLLFKEGAYNYQYLVPVKHGLTGAMTEGNHFETPNEYQVYVYYHPFGSRFDRLIGTAILK